MGQHALDNLKYGYSRDWVSCLTVQSWQLLWSYPSCFSWASCEFPKRGEATCGSRLTVFTLSIAVTVFQHCLVIRLCDARLPWSAKRQTRVEPLTWVYRTSFEQTVWFCGSSVLSTVNTFFCFVFSPLQGAIIRASWAVVSWRGVYSSPQSFSSC